VGEQLVRFDVRREGGSRRSDKENPDDQDEPAHLDNFNREEHERPPTTISKDHEEFFVVLP
jgi:hypothetical protein